eukprot:9491768-Pyramimonas_sp.AAC.1
MQLMLGYLMRTPSHRSTHPWGTDASGCYRSTVFIVVSSFPSFGALILPRLHRTAWDIQGMQRDIA